MAWAPFPKKQPNIERRKIEFRHVYSESLPRLHILPRHEGVSTGVYFILVFVVLLTEQKRFQNMALYEPFATARVIMVADIYAGNLNFLRA